MTQFSTTVETRSEKVIITDVDVWKGTVRTKANRTTVTERKASRIYIDKTKKNRKGKMWTGTNFSMAELKMVTRANLK